MSTYNPDAPILALPESNQNLLRVVYPGGAIARYLVSDEKLEAELANLSVPLAFSGTCKATVIKLTYAQRVTILPFSTALYQVGAAAKSAPLDIQAYNAVFEALQLVYDALGF